MNTFKIIIKGNLDFGNQKSFEAMFAHFQKRLELYYKNDIALKGLDFFDVDQMCLVVPRTELMCSEKTWKNTFGLLRELRTFAVAGVLHVWVLDEKNQLLVGDAIEPQGDKVATTEYNRGCLFLKKGDEMAAIESFNKAIDKYPRYAQAYERRGVAHARLGQTEDALLDFSKSIGISPNSEAYFGRALTFKTMGKIAEALAEFDVAIKNAVPFQSIFWMARRVKGETHLEQKQLKEACFELKLVSKRPFKENDPNYPYRRQAWEMYAAALEQSGNKNEAKLALEQAKALGNLGNGLETAEILRGATDAPKAVRQVAAV